MGMIINLIQSVLEVAVLIVTMILFCLQTESPMMKIRHTNLLGASDAMCIAGGLYVILLFIVILLGYVDKQIMEVKFVACISAIGSVLLVPIGCAVCALSAIESKRKNVSDFYMISGVLAVAGGLALFVDSLKAYGVF